MKFFRPRYIILLLAAIFLIIQFVPIDQSVANLPVDQDFLKSTSLNSASAEIIKRACYDCHSMETDYPWYSNFAPVSWYLQKHINHGREHLNFSEWTQYSSDDQAHLLEEMIEEIKEGEMPLKSYRLLHAEARLSEDEIEALTQSLNNL
jgi:hypothetical protein